MQTSETPASRVLSSSEEIDAAEAAWRDLERNCADPLVYFQTFDWCRNWVRHFAGSGHEPFVIGLWVGEAMVAVLPLMIVRTLGMRRLEILGVPHSQYCGIVVREGAQHYLNSGNIVKTAMALSRCDVLVLRAVPPYGMLSREAASLGRVEVADNAASMLDLSVYSSAADYAAQLGKLQKRNRNRRRNHLARRGELSFEVVWPDDRDFAALVELAANMKRRWLAETARYSTGFAMEGFDRFLGSLDGDPTRMEGAMLSVLRVGGNPAAIELGFLHRKHYYAYLGGFDWELRDLSPGKVQMEMTVGWLIDHGAETYDLLTNPADYKQTWSNCEVPIRCHAVPLTWKGALYVSTWLPKVRPALKRLHSSLPLLRGRLLDFLRGTACLLLYV